MNLRRNIIAWAVAASSLVPGTTPGFTAEELSPAVQEKRTAWLNYAGDTRIYVASRDEFMKAVIVMEGQYLPYEQRTWEVEIPVTLIDRKDLKSDQVLICIYPGPQTLESVLVPAHYLKELMRVEGMDDPPFEGAWNPTRIKARPCNPGQVRGMLAHSNP
jgi:hypothetical protein